MPKVALLQSETGPAFSADSLMEWVAIDDIHHDVLRRCVAHWNGLRGVRPWPSRDELIFRDIVHFLPYMSLVRVVEKGADFEHRFVGDIMVRAFSVPIQNRLFSDIAKDAPKVMESAFCLFRKVLETNAPVAALRKTGRDGQEVLFARAERVLLPLGQSADCIDHILTMGFNEA